MSGVPQIDGFEILEVLGKGGMATVWQARQISLDRPVAVKILDESLARDADDVRRFTDEARSAARLRHPGIVQVFEAGTSNGLHYFAMELVTGYTVGEWLRRKRQGLGEQQAITIAEYVVDALDYAYTKYGMIHCDIKPDNIMVNGDGTIKLTDLGLARMNLSGHKVNEVDILGTPAYMSPEQARGDQDLDCRADIYSLGATLYHIATGKMLFQGKGDEETMALQQSGTVPDAMAIDSSISPQFCQLLEKMMAKDRRNRHHSWASVAKDIAAVAAHRNLHGLPLAQGLSTMERCPERTSMTTAHDIPTLKSVHRTKRGFPLGLVIVLLIISAAAVFGLKAYKSWRHSAQEEIQRDAIDAMGGSETSNAVVSNTPPVSPKTVATPPPPAPEDTQPALTSTTVTLPDNDEARLYRAAIVWIRENPDDAKGAVDMMRKVVADSAGCAEVRKIARKKLEELEKDYQYQIDRTRVSLNARAGDLADWALYNRAIDLFENYDGPCSEETKAWRKEQVEKWKAESDAAYAARPIKAIRELASMNPAEQCTQQLEEESNELLRRVALEICDKGMPCGMALFEDELARKPALGATLTTYNMARIFVAYADAPKSYLAKYEKRIDDEIWLKLLDDSVGGVVIDVKQNGVMLRVKPAKRPVYTKSYSFDSLHPEERIRVLGGESTPAGNLLLGLQCVHGDKIRQAQGYFKALSSPVGDAFLAVLATR